MGPKKQKRGESQTRKLGKHLIFYPFLSNFLRAMSRFLDFKGIVFNVMRFLLEKIYDDFL